jgi:hypothetical protein
MNLPEFKAATKIIPDFMAALNSWEVSEFRVRGLDMG